jgi:hypothetical protein
MATSILPQDVTEHLEAAIQLSNRRVHLRFLDEAEVLIAFNLPAAAVLIGGVILESIHAGIREEAPSEGRQEIDRWLELRASVAHAHGATVTLDQAKEMVEGVRRLLTRNLNAGRRVDPTPADPPRQLRGKYKFVPTSADELRLEHE